MDLLMAWNCENMELFEMNNTALNNIQGLGKIMLTPGLNIYSLTNERLDLH